MTQTATTKPEISAVAIFKITSKIDGTTCWAVPSDSDKNTMYKTCFDERTHGWTCTCKHGKEMAKRGRDAKCKHTRAAQESIKANKPVVKDTSKPVVKDTSQKGVLNGNGNSERKMEVAPSGRMVWMR